ncbi:MAG: S49 family peptidase [Actinomycetota bacterium]
MDWTPAALLERLTNPPPVVTVVRLSGLISAAGGGMLRHGLHLGALAGVLDAAFSAKRLAAVALAVNSPGGSPVQSALIAKRIRALAEEKSIPVLAFVEDVAASGGYWLACAADEIIVDDSSIVGSIGVVTAGFGLHEAIGRLGIERRLYTQGERKRMLDPFLPAKPEDVARLKELQAEMHATFKDYVRERRGTRLKAAGDELFNGDIWTGRAAVALGLADTVGDLRSMLRARFGDKVRIRVVGQRRSWLRRLVRTQAGLADEALAAVEERLAWGRWGL